MEAFLRSTGREVMATYTELSILRETGQISEVQ